MRGRTFTMPGVLLVAIAAALWGLDPILRKPLAKTTEATTIVFGEHVLLVLLTLPLLLPALRAMWKAGTRYITASVAVGAGASAVATILFTDALFHSDFITPVVLQKLQPLVAVVGAAVVPGDRGAWRDLRVQRPPALVAVDRRRADHHGREPAAGAATAVDRGSAAGRAEPRVTRLTAVGSPSRGSPRHAGGGRLPR